MSNKIMQLKQYGNFDIRFIFRLPQDTSHCIEVLQNMSKYTHINALNANFMQHFSDHVQRAMEHANPHQKAVIVNWSNTSWIFADEVEHKLDFEIDLFGDTILVQDVEIGEIVSEWSLIQNIDDIIKALDVEVLASDININTENKDELRHAFIESYDGTRLTDYLDADDMAEYRQAKRNGELEHLELATFPCPITWKNINVRSLITWKEMDIENIVQSYLSELRERLRQRGDYRYKYITNEKASTLIDNAKATLDTGTEIYMPADKLEQLYRGWLEDSEHEFISGLETE